VPFSGISRLAVPPDFVFAVPVNPLDGFNQAKAWNSSLNLKIRSHAVVIN